MEVLNVCVNLDALEDHDMYVWTTLQTIENGWDSHFFVGCNLFEFYAKMWQQENVEKWLPFFFCSNTYIWMRKFNIVVNFDFEGEMNHLIPLCVHER
jgi:hypothetical protein